MAAPQRLTDEQIRHAMGVIARRRELQSKLDEYPTIQELADQIGCTPRYLTEIARGKYRANFLTPEVSESVHSPA